MKHLEKYLQEELEENKEILQENFLYRFNSKRLCLSNPSQEELIEELQNIYTRLSRIKEYPSCFLRDAMGRPYVSPQAQMSMELGYISWTSQGFELTSKGEQKLETYQKILLEEPSIQYH